GPIALIDENMPVVFVAPRDPVFSKVVSNMQEVKARGGQIIAVTTQGNDDLRGLVNHELRVPVTAPLLTPVLTVIPLQLLAYHIAARRGCDVDRPRNLAKSVTVEWTPARGACCWRWRPRASPRPRPAGGTGSEVGS